MIYQEDAGKDNSGKLPSGGVIAPATLASSMSEVISNPITFYGTYVTEVINIIGQSGDLYNYYLTSYSRGTDGARVNWTNNTNWHNLYLDSYIPLRHKSIYDPCPYGYRIPSNGTYNQFTNPGWTRYNYIGGVNWSLNEAISWFAGGGYKYETGYRYVGWIGYYLLSNIASKECVYYLFYYSSLELVTNSNDAQKTLAHPVRCIEECELLPVREWHFFKMPCLACHPDATTKLDEPVSRISLGVPLVCS